MEDGIKLITGGISVAIMGVILNLWFTAISTVLPASFSLEGLQWLFIIAGLVMIGLGIYVLIKDAGSLLGL